MGELVAQMGGTPAEQGVMVQWGRNSEEVFNLVVSLRAAGKYGEAVSAGRTGLQRYPDSIALRVVVQQAEIQQQQSETEALRRAESDRLARTADGINTPATGGPREQGRVLARQTAEAEAKRRDATANARQEAGRKQAYVNLVRESQQAMSRKAYGQAVQTRAQRGRPESCPDGFNRLAEAEKARDLALQTQAMEESKKKSLVDLQTRDMARAQMTLARKQEDAVITEHSRQELSQAVRLTEQARKDLAEGKVDDALRGARYSLALRPTVEAQQLVGQAEQAQELKLAAASSSTGRSRLDRRKTRSRRLRPGDEEGWRGGGCSSI